MNQPSLISRARASLRLCALAVAVIMATGGAAPAASTKNCEDVLCARSNDVPIAAGGWRIDVNVSSKMPGTTHFNVRVGGGKQFEAGHQGFSFNTAAHGTQVFAVQACKRGGTFSSSSCSKWVNFSHPIDAPVKRGSAQFGTDRPGNDYKSFELPGGSYPACQQACQSEQNCKAWTFVNAGVQGPNSRCYLKNTVPKQFVNNCCVSGIK